MSSDFKVSWLLHLTISVEVDILDEDVYKTSKNGHIITVLERTGPNDRRGKGNRSTNRDVNLGSHGGLVKDLGYKNSGRRL